MPGYVGVAPGTTTIMIRPDGSLGSSWLGEPPCGPPNVWPYITRPAVLGPSSTFPMGPGATPSKDIWFNPYGTESTLKGLTEIPTVRWVLAFGLTAILSGVLYSYLSNKAKR